MWLTVARHERKRGSEERLELFLKCTQTACGRTIASISRRGSEEESLETVQFCTHRLPLMTVVWVSLFIHACGAVYITCETDILNEHNKPGNCNFKNLSWHEANQKQGLESADVSYHLFFF